MERGEGVEMETTIEDLWSQYQREHHGDEQEDYPSDPREILSIQDAIIALDLNFYAPFEPGAAITLLDVYLHPEKAVRPNTLEHLTLVSYAPQKSASEQRLLAQLLLKPEHKLGAMEEPVKALVRAMDNYMAADTDIKWNRLRLGYTPIKERKLELMRVKHLLSPELHGVKAPGMYGSLLSTSQTQSHAAGVAEGIKPSTSLREQSTLNVAQALSRFLATFSTIIVLDSLNPRATRGVLPILGEELGKHLEYNFNGDELLALSDLSRSHPWAHMNNNEITSILGPLLPHLPTMKWEQLLEFSSLVHEYNWDWAVAAIEWETPAEGASVRRGSGERESGK